VFVGVGLHGLRLSTRDGEVWSDRQVGREGEHCNSVVWMGEQFVAIVQGATYLSPDGKIWQRTPNQNAPTSATYGDKYSSAPVGKAASCIRPMQSLGGKC
jgi:hypothetical protein